jgi:hypothetical protein
MFVPRDSSDQLNLATAGDGLWYDRAVEDRDVASVRIPVQSVQVAASGRLGGRLAVAVALLDDGALLNMGLGLEDGSLLGHDRAGFP